MGQRRTKEIRKHSEINEMKDTIYENLWNATKTTLKGRCIAVMLTLKRKIYLKSIT